MSVNQVLARHTPLIYRRPWREHNRSLQTGTPHIFRCARENADGQVGPWSAYLRCVVPNISGKCSSSTSGGGGGHGKNISNGDGMYCAASPPPLPRPPATSTTTAQQPRQKHRFDLLVPALVEVFAGLIDAGDRRIAQATTSATTTTATANIRPIQPSIPPPSPPAAITNTSSDAADKKSGTEGAPPRRHDHHHHQHLSSSGGDEGMRKMVWDEHWDSERAARFYRLRGQNLSVWQIPALQTLNA